MENKSPAAPRKPAPVPIGPARLDIYTDGGCSGNPGPGGWAFVILDPGAVEAARGFTAGSPRIIAEKWGAEAGTTNNRMELLAVISALEFLREAALSPKKVVAFTDSQYVQKGISEWILTWKRNNWRTSDKKPVKNQDLWQRLDELSARFPLQWQWVRGHAGNEYNERCDRLTQDAIASLR
jgi:ribonuclease HI